MKWFSHILGRKVYMAGNWQDIEYFRYAKMRETFCDNDGE